MPLVVTVGGSTAVEPVAGAVAVEAVVVEFDGTVVELNWPDVVDSEETVVTALVADEAVVVDSVLLLVVVVDRLGVLLDA